MYPSTYVYTCILEVAFVDFETKYGPKKLRIWTLFTKC